MFCGPRIVSLTRDGKGWCHRKDRSAGSCRIVPCAKRSVSSSLGQAVHQFTTSSKKCSRSCSMSRRKGRSRSDEHALSRRRRQANVRDGSKADIRSVQVPATELWNASQCCRSGRYHSSPPGLDHLSEFEGQTFATASLIRSAAAPGFID